MKVSKHLKFIFVSILLLSGVAATDRYFEISKQLDIFVSLYREVDELYVDEIDHSRIMRKAIDAMLNELDPYTVFYSESEIEDFRFQRTGKYGGIGAQVGNRDKLPFIIEPYEGYAADKAGLLAGDFLLEIDGKDVKGKTTDEISALLKGEPGTQLNVLVKREGLEPFKVEIKREEIKVDNVSYAGMITDEIGYVKFENFRENAGNEVKEHMEKLKEKGMKSFILDIRGNPGGLLMEAVNIVNLFVGPKNLVVYTKGKSADTYKEYETYKGAYDEDISVVILIDQGSASASEIVSGALQDLDRAVVIGKNSYGKGLVQITRPVSFNTQLKVTTSKYYIPSGRCIQRLDYSHRAENGKVPVIPDSLKQEFKTKSGRPVFDGAGIDPDIEMPKTIIPEVIIGLEKQNLIFDFATKYRLSHKTIPPAAKFTITDEIYNDFIKFVNTKGFTFSYKAESTLKSLESELNESKLNLSEINEIKAKLESKKQKDLIDYKKEISNKLRLEIVKRYYYQKGKAEAALMDDDDIAKAKEVLGDKVIYNKVLKP